MPFPHACSTRSITLLVLLFALLCCAVVLCCCAVVLCCLLCCCAVFCCVVAGPECHREALPHFLPPVHPAEANGRSPTFIEFPCAVVISPPSPSPSPSHPLPSPIPPPPLLSLAHALLMSRLFLQLRHVLRLTTESCLAPTQMSSTQGTLKVYYTEEQAKLPKVKMLCGDEGNGSVGGEKSKSSKK